MNTADTTTTAGYVNRDAIARMSGRELWRAYRQGGPSELVDVIELEMIARSGEGVRNRQRAGAYFRAEYHVWAARKRFPATGHDVGTGRPWPAFGTIGELGRRIERAQNAAAARVAYDHARRGYANPLALLEVHREQVR